MLFCMAFRMRALLFRMTPGTMLAILVSGVCMTFRRYGICVSRFCWLRLMDRWRNVFFAVFYFTFFPVFYSWSSTPSFVTISVGYSFPHAVDYSRNSCENPQGLPYQLARLRGGC